MEPYTVALTSCGRFDLLERTLDSLLPRLDGPLVGVTIAEDSGDHSVWDVVRKFTGCQREIDVIINDPPLGQVKSLDRLYSTINTEWVFHCEDDWEFFSEGFIEKSFRILCQNPRFSMVSIRDPADLGKDRFLPGPLTCAGVKYFAIDPAVRPEWSGLSFNPGLRRMHDYRIVGPYHAFGVTTAERHISDCYRALGYSIAHLAEPAVRHLGGGRHVRDQAKSRDFGSKMRRSILKRLARLGRTLAPGTDPVVKAKRRWERAGGFPPPVEQQDGLPGAG